MKKDIVRLFEGYQHFREQYFGEDDSPFAQLVRGGQRPKVLMIACSDSRVDPALIMNCEPGELFVIRNVANLVPPYQVDQAYHGTSAALEFGVCVLGVSDIILMGHTQCGGMQTLLEACPEKNGFLGKWLDLATEAKERTFSASEGLSQKEKVDLCGHYSLIHSLENLQTFPWIADRLNEGSLTLHAWNFDMTKGILEEYDPQTQVFRPLQNPSFVPPPPPPIPQEEPSPDLAKKPEQQVLFQFME